MSALVPLGPKLGKLIRLFGSDHEGEVVGAVRAAERMLLSAGLDWHALAAALEHGRDLDEPEGEPKSWRDIAKWCERHDDGQLKPHERAFVTQMASQLVFSDDEPSAKQG